MMYDISLGDDVVGQAAVVQQGLYYKIRCCCRLSSEARFHVRVKGTAGEENLGLLIPDGRDFVLTGSVAVKKLGENLDFCLTPCHPAREGVFVPIRADAPFPHLTQLQHGILTHREGQPGLLIQTARESSKPTGQ